MLLLFRDYSIPFENNKKNFQKTFKYTNKVIQNQYDFKLVMKYFREIGENKRVQKRGSSGDSLPQFSWGESGGF